MGCPSAYAALQTGGHASKRLLEPFPKKNPLRTTKTQLMAKKVRILEDFCLREEVAI
jgi:hypothetical protein